jgi:triphosphatase
MKTPNREIELKFDLDGVDVPTLIAALPAGEAGRQALLSVYYDTPDQALAARGLALRVRRSGDGFIQTLKSAMTADGGRDEWDWPVADQALDPALLKGGPAAFCQDAEMPARFRVEIDRTTRLVVVDGAEIEIAVDLGRAVAGEREAPFGELELELKSGPAAALFTLAGALMDAVLLSLSFVSKAARGEALLATDAPRRSAYRPPAPDRQSTAGEALQLIGRSCLIQMAANAALLRRAPGPGGVHQLRVGLRRLRSTLTTFTPILSGPDLAVLKGELEWLTGELGPARNLDVYIQDVWRPQGQARHDLPGMALFGAALLSAQAAAYRRAAQALAGDRFRRLMLSAAAWLQAGDWTAADAPAAEVRDASARDLAETVLSKRRRKLGQHAKGFAKADAAARHHLRIQAKKMRYAAEDLAAFFPDHPGRRKRFIDRLETLQDALGLLNDLTVGADLAREVAAADGHPQAVWAAGWLGGERAAGERALVHDAGKALDAFLRTKVFW